MTSKKNILIVCRGFYPQNSPRSFRATELAKELSREGHNVTVLTPKDEKVHTTFERKHNLAIHDLGKLRWKKLNFGKSKVGSIFSRLVNRLLFVAFDYPNIELMFRVPKALKKEQGYDLLISIANPYSIHWGVARVWTKNQCIAKVWVADCGDPYMGNATDSFRKWFYFKYLEKWFMYKTDNISIPIKSAKTAYYPEFHKKIKVIPQGFKLEPVNRVELFKPNIVPTFAYAGGFIPGRRDPRLFLNYLSKLEVSFKFLIYTNNPQLVLPYKLALKDKLVISGYIPREELLVRLSSVDFLVNFDNNTTTALPSKLIDYAIIKRPVLTISKNLDIKNINDFLKGEYSGKMKLPDISHYRIENVCQAFLSLADEIQN